MDCARLNKKTATKQTSLPVEIWTFLKYEKEKIYD